MTPREDVLAMAASYDDPDYNDYSPLTAAMLRALADERDAAVEKERAASSIVARIWQQLGSPTYEQLAGRSIYDLILEMQEQRDAARAEALRLREALRSTARLLAAFVNPDTDAIAKAVIDAADAALAGEARDE